jgi:hypothetical protein
MRLSCFVACAIAAFSGVASVRAQQATPSTPLELAAAGQAAEAWKSWEALPPSLEKQRTGIQLAAATKQLDRGITLYTALVTATKSPDQTSLGILAVSSAHELAASPERDVRVTACGAALLINARDTICRKLLETLAGSQTDVTDQTLGVYALANAGIRPSPGAITSLAGSMATPLRLQLAQTLTHLAPAERVALLQPLVTNPDVATQYQTALLLADIPGEAAVGPLRMLAAAMGPARMAATIGLALHGDPGAVQSVGDMLPNISGYERSLAARALAVALDRRGVDVLEAMTRSTTDIERINAAEALAKISPDHAYRTLLDSLNGGSAAVRQQALRAAGVVRMGTDPAVYRRLSGEPPMTRAWAIQAIADTLAPPAAARAPRQ